MSLRKVQESDLIVEALLVEGDILSFEGYEFPLKSSVYNFAREPLEGCIGVGVDRKAVIRRRLLLLFNRFE